MAASRVWLAMAMAEREHGGPRTMTSTDIARRLLRVDRSLTTGTINRALRELEHVGVVRVVPGRPNGNRCWQLDAPGRAKYGLPNDHARPSDGEACS